MPHPQARIVLLNYIAEMETMGLTFSNNPVNLTVKLIKKPSRKCRKVDQNWKHVRPHKEQCLHKFQTKLSHNVALTTTDQEQPMVNYNAVYLKLNCWLVDFIQCNHKMVNKLNLINEYLIWFEIWVELSNILPTCLTQEYFDEEWSKIMTILCLALQSARILHLVQDFSEEAKEYESDIPAPIDYDTCVRSAASDTGVYLWDQARSLLSEVIVPQPMFWPCMNEFSLNQIEDVAVL